MSDPRITEVLEAELRRQSADEWYDVPRLSRQLRDVLLATGAVREPEPRPVIDREAATKAAVDAILYNLPLDGFGQERRLTDYAAIWGNAAAKAVLALLPKTGDGAALPVRRDGEGALAAAPSSPIPQVEEEGDGDAALLGLVTEGQQGLGPARPALSDSPNGSAP